MRQVLYDRIGTTYEATRTTDPRLAARIWAALGDARTVLNVGAGTGHYEPPDREVTAVEPSDVMIAQRPPGAAPVVQATAEALPFEDGSFDATMGVLTDHHWGDRAAGLREMARVARDRAVLFTWDKETAREFWLVAEYLPSFAEVSNPGMAIEEIAHHLGGARIEPVPLPHDCQDGFLGAYWRRPHAYLDARVRDGISVCSLLDPDEVRQGVERLAADLGSGAWERDHADLLGRTELDLGYRLLIATRTRA